MHTPNLLKVVLKPRSAATDSLPAQSTSSGRTAKSSMSRSVSESTLDSLAQAASAGPRCLCAPTKHAGSFRCRLHRASQTQWPTPPSSNGTAQETSTGGIDIPDHDQRTRAHKKRSPMLERSPSFSPPRSPESHPSRLSKVVVAGENAATGYKKKVSSATSEGPVHISKFLSSSSTTNSSVISGTMVM